MVLGIENIPGLGFLGDINLSGFTSGLSVFGQFVFIALMGGIIVAAYYYWNNEKKLYNIKIHVFEVINGQLVPSRDEAAKEITIPGTTVKVFYLKTSKMYLPRGTRQMGKGHFWYAIRRNREWVNFILNNIDKEMKAAGLDYDHTDMTYANAQLKKLIDSNYKKEKWWQTFRNEIGMTILIIMLTFSFWFLIGEIKEVVGSLSPLVEVMKEILEELNRLLVNIDTVKSGSGLKPAA